MAAAPVRDGPCCSTLDFLLPGMLLVQRSGMGSDSLAWPISWHYWAVAAAAAVVQSTLEPAPVLALAEFLVAALQVPFEVD